jgi:transposase
MALAFEAGRDGFWLARWLAARGVEAHVIHASSLAVSREHRRAKTDRLDTELLKRGFLGWLRGPVSPELRRFSLPSSSTARRTPPILPSSSSRPRTWAEGKAQRQEEALARH